MVVLSLTDPPLVHMRILSRDNQTDASSANAECFQLLRIFFFAHSSLRMRFFSDNKGIAIGYGLV